MRLIIWLVQLLICFTVYHFWLKQLMSKYSFSHVRYSDEKIKQIIKKMKIRRQKRYQRREKTGMIRSE